MGALIYVYYMYIHTSPWLLSPSAPRKHTCSSTGRQGFAMSNVLSSPSPLWQFQECKCTRNAALNKRANQLPWLLPKHGRTDLELTQDTCKGFECYCHEPPGMLTLVSCSQATLPRRVGVTSSCRNGVLACTLLHQAINQTQIKEALSSLPAQQPHSC